MKVVNDTPLVDAFLDYYGVTVIPDYAQMEYVSKPRLLPVFCGVKLISVQLAASCSHPGGG